ncbi:MAG: type II toxin-antitoxin system HicA family toxin [Candidatus Woesearchaeota archaeon]
MPKHKIISGETCIKILCKHFDFFIARQKRSHVILKKHTRKETIGTVVPLHKELRIGTLKSILKLARVQEQEFNKHL